MFFCNTCDQPLCEACREDTHKAKMFAKHDIVVLSKRTKEIHRECGKCLKKLLNNRMLKLSKLKSCWFEECFSEKHSFCL